jgi:hypothetical protein
MLNGSDTFFPSKSSVVVGSFVPSFLVLVITADANVPFVGHQRWVPIVFVKESVADSAAVNRR